MGDRIESPCQSISPKSNRPCLKPDTHNAEDPIVVHQNGNITWGSGGQESDSLRCQSTSPRSKLACDKRNHHNRTELLPIHQNGSVVWVQGIPGEVPSNSTPKTTTSFGEALRKKVEEMMPPVYGPALFAEDRFGPHRGGYHTPDDQGGVTAMDVPDLIAASEEHQLSEWWIQQAETEIARTVPKSVEYSATDLIDIGRSMARAAGRTVDDAHAAELAVAFYALGKVSRIMGSIERGELPSMDSWFDLGVYARMAQRIREFGGWPGTGSPLAND